MRLAALALALAACGGAPSTNYPSVSPAEPRSVETTLAPGDQVEVVVFNGSTESRTTHKLSPGGEISLQYIGTVKAAGKRTGELGDEIRRRLADGYLRDPIVNITLAVSSTRTISVFGQVQKAGTIPYTDGMTIVDAIAQSGGFTAMAKKNSVEVTRTIEGKKHSFTVPVEAIGEGDRPNFAVQAGDTVFVPERLF